MVWPKCLTKVFRRDRTSTRPRIHRRQAEGLQHTGPVIAAGDRLRHFCVCRPSAVQGAVTKYARSTATTASLAVYPDGRDTRCRSCPIRPVSTCAYASRRASRWHHCGTALCPPCAGKLRILAAANTPSLASVQTPVLAPVQRENRIRCARARRPLSEKSAALRDQLLWAALPRGSRLRHGRGAPLACR
jgi:hypothetical protein